MIEAVLKAPSSNQEASLAIARLGNESPSRKTQGVLGLGVRKPRDVLRGGQPMGAAVSVELLFVVEELLFGVTVQEREKEGFGLIAVNILTGNGSSFVHEELEFVIGRGWKATAYHKNQLLDELSACRLARLLFNKRAVLSCLVGDSIEYIGGPKQNLREQPGAVLQSKPVTHKMIAPPMDDRRMPFETQQGKVKWGAGVEIEFEIAGMPTSRHLVRTRL